MNCLCCGKRLKTDDGTGWHKSCVKHFFQTEILPKIEIDQQALQELVIQNVDKGIHSTWCTEKIVITFAFGDK